MKNKIEEDKTYWLQTSEDCDTKSLGDILTRLRWKSRARCSCGIRRLCFMHLCFGEVFHKDLLKLNQQESTQ
jgi:hypothetical protein